jgi:hypothetical protein
MQIAEAFKTVGLNDSTKSIIVVKVTSESAADVTLSSVMLNRVGFSSLANASTRHRGSF